MKLFVFEDVPQLTSSYHPSGGCVVVAESLERAKELVPSVSGCDKVKTFELVGSPAEQTFIFPDAGCC